MQGDFISFLKWWLLVTVLGWAAWPLAARAFRRLPDRGLSLSRALALLLSGYVFWLFGSLGALRNDGASILLACAAVIGLSALVGYRAGWGDLRQWLKENWRTAAAMEAVFFVAFALWAIVRAYNPPLMSAGGEKWMEYAFLNGIRTSPALPPHDPWLSGYAISYYYFGYVMMAMLSRITLVPLAVSFNLGIALLFALTAQGIYGLVFNLMGLAKPERPQRWLLPAVLGILFLLVMSNYEGVLEAANNKGWASPALYSWFDVKDFPVNGPPGDTLAGEPRTFGFSPQDNYGWWRASRTVSDIDPASGGRIEIIDEFPFFSFMLGDMHPHVLVLPFTFLALGLALSFLLESEATVWRRRGGSIRAPVSPARFLLAGVALGGLAFLNTWDFPIYLFVVTGAYLLGRMRSEGWKRDVWLDALTLGAGLAALGVLLYFPFYVGFQSQAGGVLPNISFPTRFPQFFLMFGPLLLLLTFILALLLYWNRKAIRWRLFLGVTFGSALGLFVLSLLLGGVLLLSPALRETVKGLLAPLSASDALALSLSRRLLNSGAALLMSVFMGAVAALWFRKKPEEGAEGLPGTPNAAETLPVPLIFALLLIFTGSLLAIGPDFFYLRDQFGSRMNTVFKLYYQSWVLWSGAAAFGVWWVWGLIRRGLARVGALSFVLTVVGFGFVYPILALPAKTNNFQPNPGPTLDSTAEFALYNPDDFAAIEWIKVNLDGQSVLAEAVGGSYTGFARVSAFSGQPTVLGWPGHEGQWRGGYAEQGTRQDDIATLYKTREWADAESILDQYAIRYVYVGPMELSEYNPVFTAKFDQNMKVIYQVGQVTIYER